MINFNTMPPEVRNFILAQQRTTKKNKGIGQFSQQLAIVQIIKEFIEIKKNRK